MKSRINLYKIPYCGGVPSSTNILCQDRINNISRIIYMCSDSIKPTRLFLGWWAIAKSLRREDAVCPITAGFYWFATHNYSYN